MINQKVVREILAQLFFIESNSIVHKRKSIYPFTQILGMLKIFLLLIKGYQSLISPLIPKSCRFYPSCSQYAKESLQIHGWKKGLILTLLRLVKCGPWHPGGVDLPKESKARCRHRDGGEKVDH